MNTDTQTHRQTQTHTHRHTDTHTQTHTHTCYDVFYTPHMGNTYKNITIGKLCFPANLYNREDMNKNLRI